MFVTKITPRIVGANRSELFFDKIFWTDLLGVLQQFIFVREFLIYTELDAMIPHDLEVWTFVCMFSIEKKTKMIIVSVKIMEYKTDLNLQVSFVLFFFFRL